MADTWNNAAPALTSQVNNDIPDIAENFQYLKSMLNQKYKYWSTSSTVVTKDATYYPLAAESDQGADGTWGVWDILAAVSSNQCHIKLNHAAASASSTTYTWLNSQTIPNSVTLIAERGAVLSIASGKTLTIQGTFVGCDGYMHFSGAGNVVFDSGAVVLNPQAAWYANTTKANAGFANLIEAIADKEDEPSVSTNNRIYKTANSEATTITTFKNGFISQEIWVLIDDIYTTIDFTTSTLVGNNGANYVCDSGDMLHGIFDGTNWHITISGSTPTVASVGTHIEAYLGTASTGNGTEKTITFDQEAYDVGADYNNTTGIITIPADGNYIYTSDVHLRSNDDLTLTLTLKLTRTSTVVDGVSYHTHVPAMTSPGTNQGYETQATISKIFRCLTGDTIHMTHTLPNNASVRAHSTTAGSTQFTLYGPI